MIIVMVSTLHVRLRPKRHILEKDARMTNVERGTTEPVVRITDDAMVPTVVSHA